MSAYASMSEMLMDALLRGVSGGELRVLIALAANRDGLTTSELASWLRSTENSVKVTVSRLRSKGFPVSNTRRHYGPTKATPEKQGFYTLAVEIQEAATFAVLRFNSDTPGNENEMPKVISCNWLPDGDYAVLLAPQSSPSN